MYEVGVRIVSIKGEHDNDVNDQFRETGPNAEGYIKEVLRGEEDGQPYYSVIFPASGVWVFLDDEELANPDLYKILSILGTVAQ